MLQGTYRMGLSLSVHLDDPNNNKFAYHEQDQDEGGILRSEDNLSWE